MICSRCGCTTEVYTNASSCPLCGFQGVEGRVSMNTGAIIAPWESSLAGSKPIYTLVRSFEQSFLKSRPFFAKIVSSPSLVPALLYGMIFGNIGACATVLWSQFPMFSASTVFSTKAVSAGSLIAVPVVVLLQFFLSALLVHFLLMVTGGRKKTFLYTFKVSCYAGGALLFNVVPLAGPLISAIACLYLTIVGIGTAHGLSTRRTIFTLLVIPLVVAGFLLAAAAILLALVSFTAGSSFDFLSLLRER